MIRLYSPLAAGTLLRYAAEFEPLRDRSDVYLEHTGSRPQALLLPLGPLAEHNIRTTFAANLLASGGIEAVNPGTVEADGVQKAAVDAGSPTVAVICGTDNRYGGEAAAVVEAARRAGVATYVWRARKKRWQTPNTSPTSFSPRKSMRWKHFRALLNRLGA